MSHSEVIATRIAKIKESLELLGPLSKISLEDFTRNPDHYLKGERLLEVTIQAMIDIGTYLVSIRSLKKPKDYHEVFDILAEHQLIPRNLLTSLHGMVGLRNVLIHEYFTINRKTLHKIICNDLDDVRSFVEAIVRSSKPKIT